MKEVDYSTSAGSVTRFTYVDINGGTIHRNVYGGGSLSSVGPPAIPPTRVETAYKKGTITRDDGTAAGPGWWSQCNVNIRGTVGSSGEYQAHYGGEVYGASRGNITLGESFGNVVWTLVRILGGADIKGNVFGGGDNGHVKKDTNVIVGDEDVPEEDSTSSTGSDSGSGNTSGDSGNTSGDSGNTSGGNGNTSGDNGGSGNGGNGNDGNGN